MIGQLATFWRTSMNPTTNSPQNCKTYIGSMVCAQIKSPQLLQICKCRPVDACDLIVLQVEHLQWVEPFEHVPKISRNKLLGDRSFRRVAIYLVMVLIWFPLRLSFFNDVNFANVPSSMVAMSLSFSDNSRNSGVKSKTPVESELILLPATEELCVQESRGRRWTSLPDRSNSRRLVSPCSIDRFIPFRWLFRR